MDSGEASKLEIDWHFLILVAIIAFVGRLLYVFTLETTQFYFDDSYQWNQIALNILAGKGLIISPSAMAFRMPLYPLFLSGIYYLFGSQNLLAVRIIQTMLSTLTVVIIYFIAISVFNEDKHAERIGKISAIISVFYPFFVYYSGAILNETLFIFLLSLVIWVLIRGRFFWAAILLGLSVLCRAEILLFIIFIIIGLFAILKKRDALRVSFIMFLLLCVILSPWVARNYLIFNKFVPLSTMGGYTFYEGNAPENLTGGPFGGKFFLKIPEGLDEVEIDEYYRNETIRVIKENPERFIKLCWSKFKRFWNIKLNTDDPRYASLRNNLISIFSFGPILLLFIPGLIISFWNRKNLVFLYLIILYVMLINLTFVSSLRYRLPIEPYLIIFASYSLSVLFKKEK